jgi:hypothetical protein
MEKVIFIDTNIYLDFYRLRNEMSHQFLAQLQSLQDSVVMTYQVETEFKNNRQKVMVETFKSLKKPLTCPPSVGQVTPCFWRFERLGSATGRA